MNISGTEAFPSDISRTAPLGGAFAGKVAAAKNSDSSPKYPLLEHACGGKFPDVVKLARRVLAESEDGGIVYISVGSLPNAARLLESPPDEISPLTGACRAVEFSLRGFLRRRTPSRSQKPFAPSYQALSAHCIPIVFIATVCGFWLSLHLFAILLFPTSPSNALIDRYKLAV